MDTEKLRVLIIDDEPLARRKLRNWLRADSGVILAGECGNALDALRFLETSPADALFLDIEMPEMSGLEMLEHLHHIAPEKAPLVVFVTAYDRYAIDAFKRHALDYLLKPYDHARFSESLARVKKQHYQAQRSGLGIDLFAALRALQPQRYIERFVIKTRKEILFLNASDVDWIEADGNYVMLHAGKDAHLVRDSIGALEYKLNPALFARIHRSTILNLNRVRSLSPASHGDFSVRLHDGATLLLSRTYRDKLRSLLQVDF